MENERKQIACPKCGQENPADAQLCNACGGPLTQAGPMTQKVAVKVSRLAIASCVSALLALACFTPGMIAIIDPWMLNPNSDVITAAAVLAVLAIGVALGLGLFALSRIGSSGGRLTGRGFAAIGTAIPALQLLVLISVPAFSGSRTFSMRMQCGINLSGLGKAMLIYSNDYDGEFPRAGEKSSVWAPKIPNWQATNRRAAYGLRADGSGGQASISASLYLLVKYAEVEPKRFVCLNDRRITQFKLRWPAARDKELIDLWDFGPEPWKHCSFSYHNPYGQYSLTTACEPGLAVAADRNPWMASPFVKARDFGKFNLGKEWEEMRASNAVAHNYDGQNVLFLDNHVNFERNSFCGINEDNIYTSWDGQDIRRGVPPKLGSQPADRSDSLLVNDPPVPR